MPVVTASLCALAVLWIRQRSMLDLWLMVVLFLFVIEMPISYFPDPARFSLGWYTARVIGFFNSGILLTVLLYEITTLYARLLHAIRGQHSETPYLRALNSRDQNQKEAGDRSGRGRNSPPHLQSMSTRRRPIGCTWCEGDRQVAERTRLPQPSRKNIRRRDDPSASNKYCVHRTLEI